MKKRSLVLTATAAACAVAFAASMWSDIGSRLSTLQASQVTANATDASATSPGLAQASNALLPVDARVQFGQWQFAGPANIGAEAVSLVAGAGNRLYALSISGTVFRSDAAANWSAVATATAQDGMRRSFRDLAVLEATESRPLTAFALVSTTYEPPLYRLVEGQPAQRLTIQGVVKIKAVGQAVYAGTNTGLWRSDDDGDSWQQLVAASTSGCTEVQAQGNRVYAVCDDTFYRSTDGGAFEGSWRDNNLYYARLAVSRSNPSVVYASTSANDGGIWLWRSADAGTTWASKMVPWDNTNPMNGSLLGKFESDCAGNSAYVIPYDYALAVDPLDPDVIWVGANDLYRSDDGGASFGRASLDPARGQDTHRLPQGIRTIAFPSGYDGTTNAAMFVATSGGVHVTRNPRAALQRYPQTTCATSSGPPAVEWSSAIDGYSAQLVTAVDVLANGEALATIGQGATGGLFYGSLDEPDGWLRMSAERPTTLAIDPAQGLDRFYTAPCDLGLLCRWGWNAFSDRWETGLANQGIHPFTNAIPFFAIDPRNPQRVWSAGYYGVVRSDDAASTWQAKDSTSHGWGLTTGAVSPADSNIVIFGDGGGGIYRRGDALTANSSTTWPMTKLVGMWAIRSITFDPSQPQRVYASGDGVPAVFASTDAGITWRAADRPGADDGLPDSEVLSMAVDPEVGDVLYAGTRTGLYVTWNHNAVDGSEPVWFEVPTPFRGVAVNKLLVRKTSGGDRLLYAFTAGRGIWVAPVSATRFNDVARTQWSYDYINRLQAAGITNGCATAPMSYCPGDPVLREQMAAFLLRATHGGSYQPPLANGYFADVPPQHWAVNWIEQLRAEGITNGCATDPAQYCPGDQVPREQMAVFLLRAKHGPGYVPPTATGMFADVPLDSWTAPWIEQLAREGIANGCSAEPALYCPTDPVTREQMAAFLARAFAL